MAKKNEKKEESLSKQLGIDDNHFNTIAKDIIEKIATGELTDRKEIIKMAKEFTEAERDLLITIGIEALIQQMYNPIRMVCPPGCGNHD